MLRISSIETESNYHPGSTPQQPMSSDLVEQVTYSLLTCPPLTNCTFTLIDRSKNDILLIGDLEHDAPSLNLARLRHIAANLGAPVAAIDVHVLSPARQRRAH